MTRPEYLDVVDRCDRLIGKQTRAEVHQQALLHRAAHVLVFNASGQVFLQRRSLSKDMAPGLWDSSAAGHVESGETYDQCARREVKEELGLELPVNPTPLFKLQAEPGTGWEFVWVYSCVAPGPFELAAEEIDSGHWYDPVCMDALTEVDSPMLTTTLKIIWHSLRA